MLQGDVSSRPWGATLGALAAHRSTGELVLTGEDGKCYSIELVNGMIVRATSPLAADSALRVAMTCHLVSSTQVGALTKQVAAAPDGDEIAIIAEAVHLNQEHVDRLHRRTITQRAARTFSIDRGTYTFTARPVTAAPTYAIDVGAAILLGARMNLSEVRLTEDLRQLGARFVLRTEFDRTQLGLTDVEEPILSDLRVGTTLAELDARHREIEPRIVQAAVYALTAIGVCDGIGGRPPTRELSSVPMPPRTVSDLAIPQRARSQPGVARTVTPLSARAEPPAVARTVTPPAFARAQTTPRVPSNPLVSRTPTPQPAVPRTFTPVPPRTTTPELERRPTRDFVRRDPRAPTREVASSPVIPDDAVASSPSSPSGSFEFEANRQRTITAEALQPSAMPRTRSSPSIPRTSTPRNLAQVVETIAWGTDLLAKRADHFAFFGLTRTASLDSIRSAFVALTNQLHPDKIPALDDDLLAQGHRLFAHVTAAFAVVSDPVRRGAYIDSLPPEEPQALSRSPQTAVVESPAEKARLAAEAHKKGLAALKRDDVVAALDELGRAVTLMPADVDYHAALAWARFCASSDRRAIAPETRKALERAVHRSPKPAVARFYLGRVERMLGRIEQALEHFREVVDLDPGNTEAATEIRMLEPRHKTRR